MAQKNKRPVVQTARGEIITEVERLEFIIELNEKTISNEDNVINDILEEQITKLQLRLAEAKKKSRA